MYIMVHDYVVSVQINVNQFLMEWVEHINCDLNVKNVISLYSY